MQIYLCYFFQLVLIFGPFWVIIGLFRQFWVIFWPIWPILGHFWAILGNFRSFLGHFANFVWQNIALCYLNHFLQLCGQVGDRLSSLVTGSPPIWITKRSGWLYFRSPIKCLMVFDIITNWCWSNFPNSSQARALERSIKLTSDSGEEQVTIVNIHLRLDNLRHCLHQMVFVIDSVLEPLLTNSIRNASFNQDITAGKLLARCVELTSPQPTCFWNIHGSWGTWLRLDWGSELAIWARTKNESPPLTKVEGSRF